MDGRSHRRGFALQVFVASVLVLGLYLVLVKIDTPALSIWELFKGIAKFVLGPFGFYRRIPLDVWSVFLDIAIFLMAFLISIWLFAQYTLPVRNTVQRGLAGLYLFWHAVGVHGPAVHIENGKLPTEKPKRDPRGRGILILDSASAALLRRRAEFTRSVGPGLVFTRREEYIAGVMDLHRKAWPLPPGFGPRGDDEDPFAVRDEYKESLDAYEQRQKRRYETSAETRDGVELVPNIFVFSQIDPQLEKSARIKVPGLGRIREWLLPYMESESRSPFGYNPEAVRMAITGEVIDPNVPLEEIDQRRLPWYQLPVFLAVDLWREYARKFTFEELFNELPAYGNRTALQVIQEKVAERLKQPLVEEIDAFGQPTGKLFISYEHQVVQRRGIKVLYAPIRNLHFQKQVDQQLEDKWFAYWRWRADDEREFVERLRSYRMHEGEMEALRGFAHHAALRFDKDFLTLARPNQGSELRDQMRLSLEYMLRGTLRQCVSDSQLHPRLAGEEAQLAAIINWLRREKTE